MKMFPWLLPPGSSDILSQQLLPSLPIPHTQMQQNKQKLYIPFPSMLPYNCCLQNSWSSGTVGDRRAHLYGLATPAPLPTGVWRYRAARRGKLTTWAAAPLLCSTVFAAPFTTSSAHLKYQAQCSNDSSLLKADLRILSKAVIAIPEGIPWPWLSI